jgi:hypothetical protein
LSQICRQFSHCFDFLFLATLLLIEQARILFDYEQYHTNLDQTLLWYAAKEFIHGKMHEPNFYGQAYNTTFESIPGELLHIIGLPFGLSVPLSSMIFVTGIWTSLAAIAYHLGKRKTALLALAAPIIMRPQYLVLFDAPRGILAGDFLAIIAVACALWFCKDSVKKLAALTALGGLAIVWDFAATFIVVPVFLYLLCTEWTKIWVKPKRTFLFVAVSALLPISWLTLQWEWYSGHPYDLTAKSVSIIPHWSIFLQSTHHISGYFAYFAPVLAPIQLVASGLFCILVASILFVGIKRRSYGLFLSALSLVLLICLALSLPDATNFLPDFYLSASRLILTLPLAIWLLILLLSMDKEGSHRPVTKKHGNFIVTKGPVWLLIVIATVSFSVTQINFDQTIHRTVYLDLSSLDNPKALAASCQRIYTVYKETNAQLYAINDPNKAYGCAAQYDRLSTLDPAFDRRGWIIKVSYTKPIERILVLGKSCNIELPKSDKCIVEKDNSLLIETPPTIAATTLSMLGLPVRHTDH